MRVTKTQLRRIIREEKRKVLAENRVRRTVRRALREYMNPGEVRDPNRVEGDGSVVLSIFGNQSESIDEVVQAENYYHVNRDVEGLSWRWATPEETATGWGHPPRACTGAHRPVERYRALVLGCLQR